MKEILSRQFSDPTEVVKDCWRHFADGMHDPQLMRCYRYSVDG